MKNFCIPEGELMSSGHLACQGCAGANAMRYALKALGEQTILVMPACCWAVINGPFPHSAVTVPVFQTAFETAGSTASGIRAGLAMKGDNETTVLAWAGDGGTFDIGLQALSGAAERNDDIIFACYDNEAYMNTGIQRSSATPEGAWTTTTPAGHTEDHPKKRILDIIAAHRIPYIATTTVAYPDDVIAKFQKAKEMKGMKFIHIFAPCPTGWKSAPEMTIELARLAVETKMFPMLEIFGGTDYHVKTDFTQKPVGDYLELQGRFGKLTDEQVAAAQNHVDGEWEALIKKTEGAGVPR